METLQKELKDLCHTIRASVVTLIELEGVTMSEYALKFGIPLDIMQAIHLMQFEKVTDSVVRMLVGKKTARQYEKWTRLAQIEKQQEWEMLLHGIFFTSRR